MNRRNFLQVIFGSPIIQLSSGHFWEMTQQENDIMIRFYLAPIVELEHPPFGYASAVHLYVDTGAGDSYIAIMPNPYKSWSLARVAASDATHAAIQDDEEITLIPFWNSGGDYLPLTATVAEIAEPYRSNIATYMEDHRIPTGWISGDMTLGRIVKYIIQVLLTVQRLKNDYPEFDLDTVISDVPAAQRQRILAWMNDQGIETGDITLSWSVRQVLQRIVEQYGWSAIIKFGAALL